MPAPRSIVAAEELHCVEDAYRLLRPIMSAAAHELFHVVHLDGARRVLEINTSIGDPSSVELPIATILRRAVVLGARGLMIAHNHPSGDPTPSAADIEATRRLAETARDLDLHIYDHLVFAGDRCTSFRTLGLL